MHYTNHELTVQNTQLKFENRRLEIELRAKKYGFFARVKAGIKAFLDPRKLKLD